jgi:16S rRNA (uracil1498-N3)-methyltransferase
MTTLLVTPESFERESLTVEGDPYRHLFRASRLGVGDGLRVVDGRGNARSAAVAGVGRRSAELRLGAPVPDNEARRSVEVLVAPPKIGRASWMVEKLTEVGVRAIHFWMTERGPRSYGAANLERLRRVAVAAVEQCERSLVPELENRAWGEGVERLRSFGRRWLLTPGAPPAPKLEPDDPAPLALLVGPEGGWTDEELAELDRLPCAAFGLGSRILRVETAAVVGAARALLAE